MEVQRETAWTLDAHGFVRGIRYHDGTLSSLQLSAVAASVTVNPMGGGETHFRFGGAIEYGCQALVDNAIVGNVWGVVIDRNLDLSRDLQAAIDVLHSGIYRAGDITMTDRLLLRQEGRILVHFACSYGGALAILADRMTTWVAGYELDD